MQRNMTNDSAKPIKTADSDRPEPIADARLAALEELSALDQELELKHGVTGNPMIKAQHRTPDEPVAWWVQGCEYDTGCEYEFVTLLKEQAELAATNGGKAVPLYRSPTLTPEERMAVAWAVDAASNDEHPAEDILRGLLERAAKWGTTQPRNGAVDTPDSQPTPGEGSTQDQGICPPSR